MSLKKKGKVAFSSFAITSLLLSPNFALANDSLNDLESKKTNLEQDVNSKKNSISKAEQSLKKVEKSIKEKEAQLFALQSKIEATQIEISKKEDEIKEIKKEIEEIKALIVQKTEELEAKKDKLEEHIKFMYSGGKVTFLEALFRSESLMQFINRYEKFNDISAEAVILHDEIVEEIEFIEGQKAQLETKKDSLESEKEKLETIKTTQLQQKEEQNRLLEELEQQEHHIHGEINEQEEAMKLIMSDIIKMEAQIEKEQERIRKQKEAEAKAAAAAKALAEKNKQRSSSNTTTSVEKSPSSSSQSNSTSKKSASSQASSSNSSSSASGLGNGTLASPMERGTYYLSSHFGYRSDPFDGTRTLHNGTDFAAPLGTPIYAMEDGYVLYAGPANGYGNWIVIKHDNGLYTGYGHMYSSQLYVNPGERVSRGQKIGGVGSAGSSTGNHLHFFVSKGSPNSNHVNPLNYIQR